MDVTDEVLLNSGFTPSDLQKIKNNVESYGGTWGKRFRIWLIDSGMSDGFYHFNVVFCERNRRRWWDIHSDRNSHRGIHSATSSFLQILAVLEKIQRLMVRCVS